MLIAFYLHRLPPTQIIDPHGPDASELIHRCYPLRPPLTSYRSSFDTGNDWVSRLNPLSSQWVTPPGGKQGTIEGGCLVRLHPDLDNVIADLLASQHGVAQAGEALLEFPPGVVYANLGCQPSELATPMADTRTQKPPGARVTHATLGNGYDGRHMDSDPPPMTIPPPFDSSPLATLRHAFDSVKSARPSESPQLSMGHTYQDEER
ncbi:hypothetical protein C8R43DRAFT_1119337 [Mycena crocata]|nr:hypothetical protein C8R43DRAFT_1119337 [Mycena crocata]